jgi:hypothetical protein
MLCCALRLIHRGLPPGQQQIHAGWQHFLARLADVVTEVNPGPDPWQQDPPRSP